MFLSVQSPTEAGGCTFPAGARYTKSIARHELRHKEHNNNPYSVHNNTIDFTRENETIVHILTWYIEHHPLSRGIPLISLRVSLIIANTVAAERLAFTAGFEAVLEDEWRHLDPSLSSSATPLWCLRIRTYLLTIQLKTKWPPMMNM